jgi:hypothetical protein
MIVKEAQDSNALLLAQAPHARVIIDDSLAHHFALRLGQAFGGVLKFGDRVFVQRESHLYHTKAILPYSSVDPAISFGAITPSREGGDSAISLGTVY